MTRAESVALALSLLADEDIVVAAGGSIAREVFRAKDRPRNFYLFGATGNAAAVALGLAMTRFERVVAVDGDGGTLMGLGGLAQIGGLRPGNLYHLVLDNGVYGDTGGQPALSQSVDLSAVAAASGYHWARKCYAGVYAHMAIEQWLEAPGPALLDAVIDEPDGEPAPPVPLSPAELRERFRGALAL